MIPTALDVPDGTVLQCGATRLTVFRHDLGQQALPVYWDRVYVCTGPILEKRWVFRSESRAPEPWIPEQHDFHVQQLLLPTFDARLETEFPLVATWRADPGSFWVFEGWRTAAPGCGS